MLLSDMLNSPCKSAACSYLGTSSKGLGFANPLLGPANS